MDVLVCFSTCLIFYHLSTAESLHAKLMFASPQSIIEVDMDTHKLTVLVSHGGSVVYSLDYDYKNGYVYFPRFTFKDIVRFQYPSKNITLQRVVNTLSNPSDIAVDSANDHVYWLNDDSGNKLSRCNLDGTNVVVIFTTLNYALMLRLDVENRWMYIGYHNKGVSKSRFDLTEISMIVNFTSNSFVRVVGMDIDLTEQRIYWINYYGHIKSVNVDGSDVRAVISTNFPSLEYYALEVFDSYIFYYTDENKQLVMRNKSQGFTPIDLYTSTDWIKGIYVFKSTENMHYRKQMKTKSS